MQAETVNSTNDIVSLEDRGWQFHEHSVWMSLCGFRYGWSNFDSSKQEKNQWQRQDIHVNSEDLKKSGFWWFQCSFMDYLSKWLETNNIDYFTLMNIIFIFATKCRKTSSHYVGMNHILGHIRISKEDALTNTDVYTFALDVYEWGCHIYTTRPSSSSVFFFNFSLSPIQLTYFYIFHLHHHHHHLILLMNVIQVNTVQHIHFPFRSIRIHTFAYTQHRDTTFICSWLRCRS